MVPLDPAQVVASQVAAEKNKNYTLLLSESFKAAHESVPKDEDNIEASVLSTGYDIPQGIVKIADVRYDRGDTNKATALVTMRYVNDNAPTPSFNKDVIVSFVRENNQWKIDDVRLLSQEKVGMKGGREAWVKSSYQAMAPQPKGFDPSVCARPAPAGSMPDPRSTPGGFSLLKDISSHESDPNRQTIADKFVKAIGSACPFTYQLVDINGDGLADLVLQLSDRKLGATDDGLRRTAIYALDRQGRWQPMIDGLARGVGLRRNSAGEAEVAYSGTRDWKSWRQQGASFVPSKE